MIAAQENLPTLTPEEYFTWEEQQLEKHELIDGQLYAMSGGSVNHGRLAIRLTALFNSHLENSNCITGNSDIKINIELKSINLSFPIEPIYRHLNLTPEDDLRWSVTQLKLQEIQ